MTIGRYFKEKSKKIVLIALISPLLIFGISQNTNAELSTTFDLDSAEVLPQGVRNPRFKQLMIWIDSRFDNDGNSIPLGNQLNRVLTWKDLIDAQNKEIDKTKLKGTIKDAGQTLDDSPGETTGEANAFIDVKVPIFAVGVSNTWTLGFIVPIYNISVNASTGFVRSLLGEEWYKKLGPSDQVDVKKQLDDPINKKLESMGYNKIQSKSQSSVGDIKVMSKHLLHRNALDSLGLGLTVTVPTGTPSDPNDLLDLSTGDGQTDLGVNLSWDHRFTSRLTFNYNMGFTVQFADQIEKRIPVEKDDPLSEDKELVNRDLGDQWNIGTSLSYNWPSLGLTSGVGYSYQKMGATKYFGNRYKNFRYKWLSDLEPTQSLHSLIGSVSLSTIEWFKRKAFPIPLQLALSVGYPLSGDGLKSTEIVSADFVMFF